MYGIHGLGYNIKRRKKKGKRKEKRKEKGKRKGMGMGKKMKKFGFRRREGYGPFYGAPRRLNGF